MNVKQMNYRGRGGEIQLDVLPNLNKHFCQVKVVSAQPTERRRPKKSAQNEPEVSLTEFVRKFGLNRENGRTACKVSFEMKGECIRSPCALACGLDEC